MIHVIPSEQRHHQNFGWLDARWHFSFGDYYDPRNMGWGPLRVFNDDVIAGAGGFGAHPHRDMEIITVVLSGVLEHSDSLGHKQQIRPGEVQVMSAGKGIVHAEYNASRTEPVHLMQIWIEPRTTGSEPRYDQKLFDLARMDVLIPVVSNGSIEGTLSIDQDATIQRATLSAGAEVKHRIGDGRKGYVFVVSGALSLNGKPLVAGDQARIEDESELSFSATAPAELLLIDLPA